MGSFVLEMTGITKRFPGVLALDGVDFNLKGGEVHCLVGENGAGKSTLMKILAGALTADSGEIRLGGEPTVIASPHHAQVLGVSMIYQEFNLSPYLSIAENIFLGREPRIPNTPFINGRKLNEDARALLKRIQVDMDVRRPVKECSVAQQQMVEIAKALSFNSKLIVMDEPSATLTEHELRSLFALIHDLKSEGIGLVYISHRLDEIFEIGDRVTIMRDGSVVVCQDVKDTTRADIIRKMVGRELKDEFPKEEVEIGEERLRVEGLSLEGSFQGVSFDLKAGEIVGLTGLIGAGRTEVARAIFGADRADAGRIFLDGEPVEIHSPRDAIRLGVGLLTEDRKQQGLVLGMSVRENMTLANLKELVSGLFVNRNKEKEVVSHFVDELRIKTPTIEQTTKNLSGGNQQKVVLAKWLFTNSRMLIFDEPTRGIDVGAKIEIYRLMNNLVREGVAILMISSELPEIVGMCDRVLVMHEGRIAGELARVDATQEAIMRLATGEEQAVAS